MSHPGTNEKTSTPTNIRKADHTRASDQAKELGSNRQEIISAWGDVFESLPLAKKKAAIARVRERHPLPYPRIGRGNKGRNPSLVA